MTQFYTDQMTAIREAQRRGMSMFDTPHVAGEGWTIAHAGGAQAEWAKAWAEAGDFIVDRHAPKLNAFVAHVGERDGKPLIRITCRPDEITAEDAVPEEFIVEGCVPSLWLTDAEIAFKYGIRTIKTRGEGNHNSSTTDARLNPELRAKSTFEGSPVKFVHGMCDDMHAAGEFDRKIAIAKAIEAGVTKNTATAQVYRWRKNNDM